MNSNLIVSSKEKLESNKIHKRYITNEEEKGIFVSFKVIREASKEEQIKFWIAKDAIPSLIEGGFYYEVQVLD